MARKKAENIRDRIAEAVEKEIRINKHENQMPEEVDGRSLDDELDFDTPNFGDIMEDDYD